MDRDVDHARLRQRLQLDVAAPFGILAHAFTIRGKVAVDKRGKVVRVVLQIIDGKLSVVVVPRLISI